MIISVTERQSFRQCRRQWDYQSLNRRRLTKLMPPTFFSYGTLVHYALDQWLQWYKDHPEQIADPNLPADDPLYFNLKEVFLAASVKEVQRIRDTYTAQVGMAMNPEETMPFAIVMEQGMKLMEMYQEYYKTPIDKGLSVVQTEQTIVIPIPNTDSYLSGRLDGIMQDARGTYYIIEHKTYARRPDVQSLYDNDQFLAYIWMLKQTGIGNIGGVAYDGLSKHEYVEKHKEWSKLESFFLRTLISRNESSLIEFEKFLAYEALEMTNPNTPIYTNRSFTCNWCMYKDLCSGQTNGDDISVLLSTQYTERSDDVKMEIED